MMAEALRLARRINGFSPTAITIAKRILDRIETMDLRAAYEYEQGFTVQMSGHPDSKEALRAFAQKRPAAYLKRDPKAEWPSGQAG